MKMMTTTAAAALALTTFAGTHERVYVQMETKDIADYAKSVEIAKRFGATHVYANQIDPSMWQWDAAMNGRTSV